MKVPLDIDIRRTESLTTPELNEIWTVTDGQASDLVWHLRYDDEYLRTPAGWRIHGRALTINAIETRPVRRLRGRP